MINLNTDLRSSPRKRGPSTDAQPPLGSRFRGNEREGKADRM